MRLIVTVKTRAREERVEMTSETEVRVHVKAPPVEGKANAAVIALLGKALGIPKHRLTILKGRASKTKVIEIRT